MSNNPSRISQLINNIKASQESDRRLLTRLNTLPDNNNTYLEQNSILTDLVNNSNERKNTFRQLILGYNSVNNSGNKTIDHISDNIKYLELIERNLEENIKKIEGNRIKNINNLRNASVKTYYSEKYNAYLNVIKTIFYFLIPILFIVILKNKDIIPLNVMGYSITILIVICIFIIVPMIYDIRDRNNMVFSQYDFKRNMKNENWDTNNNNNNNNNNLNLPTIECVGASCCSAGMLYDNQRDVCVLDQGNNNINGSNI